MDPVWGVSRGSGAHINQIRRSQAAWWLYTQGVFTPTSPTNRASEVDIMEVAEGQIKGNYYWRLNSSADAGKSTVSSTVNMLAPATFKTYRATIPASGTNGTVRFYVNGALRSSLPNRTLPVDRMRLIIHNKPFRFGTAVGNGPVATLRADYARYDDR
ncbi:MAG: hypothetical protein AAFX93_20150 [Verrucomicrobiota bacterium]